MAISRLFEHVMRLNEGKDLSTVPGTVGYVFKHIQQNEPIEMKDGTTINPTAEEHALFECNGKLRKDDYIEGFRALFAKYDLNTPWTKNFMNNLLKKSPREIDFYVYNSLLSAMGLKVA